MTLKYPFASSALASKGAIPSDSLPNRAEHFNRLFRSVVALQAAIGKDIEGTVADLKTRLDFEMNAGGQLAREVITDDDPSGNEQGSRRYWDGQQQNVTVGSPGRTFPMSIGYTLFAEPPVVMFCVHPTAAQGYNTDMSRKLLVDIEPENVRVFFSAIDGASPLATATRAVAWLTVSQNVEVYENDRAWILPPNRTGS